MKQPQRRYSRLSDEELDQVAELCAQGHSVSSIARVLGRAKSTISELIRTNSDRRGHSTFRAALALRRRAKHRERQRKKVKLDHHEDLLLEVYMRRVFLHHSPEQIARRLKQEYPRDTSMHLSVETIYEYVFVRARGTLRDDLIASLRHPQRHRGQRRRRATLQGKLPHILSIDERPLGVLTRRIPGHWESDLIVGKGHKSALISLVERKFRYLILIRITSLDADTFAEKVSHVLNALPRKL